MPATPITELDFETIKSQIQTYLQSQEQFKDYNYAGSNMSVLLDVLAYNTHMNNFYANMALSESFLDSAQLRSSVMSHAKELNYLPGSVTSSRLTATVTLAVGDSPSYVSIPKNTEFSTTVGGETHVFMNTEAGIVYPANGVYSTAGLVLTEGRLVKENFVVTSSDDQRFVISNKDVDVSTVSVYVRDTTSPSSNTSEYSRKSAVFGVAATDKVFFIQPYDDDQYEVTFGKNVFGLQPSAGQVVEVEYFRSQGANTNGISQVSAGTIGGYAATVTVTANSSGGSDRENVSSVKYFAPRSIQIQDRAVTTTDYEILLKSNFSEIEAISVYGGEEANPPRYGQVIVAVDVAGADGLSDNDKNRYKAFLASRTPVGIDPTIIAPSFMYVDIVTSVNYDTRTTASSPAAIQSAVRAAIASYSSNSLADFNKTVRRSRIVQAIDDSDPNVISNDTEIRPIIEIQPTLNTAATYDLQFGMKLQDTLAFQATDSLSKFNPTVRSTSFTTGGSTGFIIDDGEGNLDIINASGSDFNYVKRNVGTVNYETGQVIIQSLNITEYTGAAIKVYVRTSAADFAAPKSRIVSIRDSDVTVTINGVTD